VHELYSGTDVREAVVARWGTEVAPDGTVDRAAVAAKAFADPQERTWLESELWPRVGARIAVWRKAEEARDPAPPVLVVEVPLLFEAGMDTAFDATIAVVADEAVRERRAGARGQVGLDERTSRQLTQDEKAARATWVVANSGTLAELDTALSGILAKLMT
jgi:dephospho-CoA kinase